MLMWYRMADDSIVAINSEPMKEPNIPEEKT